MKDYKEKKYSDCSLGMKKKMRLIQAFMESHPIYILDEPTSSLDKDMVKKVVSLIDKLKKNSLVIITSHYESDIEQLADLSYEVVEGRLLVNEK